MSVYDCTMFLNENDLFEIRINEHWDFIDKFILIEANETHTGLIKGFKFDQKRFEKYSEKLVYVQIKDFKEEMEKYPQFIETVGHYSNDHKEDWHRDRFQYNYMIKVLNDINAKDDDLIYMSCLDEILKKDAFYRSLEYFKDKNALYNNLRPILFFHMYVYGYKINLLHKHWSEHLCSQITEFSNLKKIHPSLIRSKMMATHPHIQDAGWHFTFLDPTDGDLVLEKQRSWSHSKDIYPGKKIKFNHTTKEEAVKRFFEDYSTTIVEIKSGTHPEYIINNLEKFKNFIYNFC